MSQGKPSWNSSAFFHLYSSNAFDGSWQTCQYSDNQLNNEWIKVDLKKPSIIARVQIYSGTFVTGLIAENAMIEVASSFDMMQDYQVCAKLGKLPFLLKTFKCEKTVLGRYVRLVLNQQGFLTVCEMQVMGYYY